MKKVYVYPTWELSKSQKQALTQNIPASFCFDEPSEERLKEASIIIGNPRRQHLSWCTRLEWIQLISAGSDQYRTIPESILLTNASGTFGTAIAEHMICVTLMMMKRMPQYQRYQMHSVWKNAGRIDSIINSTFVILGMGDLGSEYAKRIKALGGYVIGIKKHPAPCPDYLDELYTMEALEKLLPRADVLAMCLPNHEETQHIMNEHTFTLMKPGSYLINTGRGSAIDETALCEALDTRLKGAALDVTKVEPLPKDSPLWLREDVILTPHISGNWNLPSTIDRFLTIAHENLLAFFEGRPLHNLVDRTSGYRNTQGIYDERK